MRVSYRYCPRCAAPRDGDMPFCGACAYAFPDTDTTLEDRRAETPPLAPTGLESSSPQWMRPEHAQGRSSRGWWTPTRILGAFGIVVGVMFAGALSQRADAYGVLAYVLLNPILWVAAVLAAVSLFRQGRKDLAGGVLGLSIVPVLAFMGLLYFSPQVVSVPQPSEPSIFPVRTPTPLELCLEDRINAGIDRFNAQHPRNTMSHWSAPFSQLEWQQIRLNWPDRVEGCRTLLGIPTPAPIR